MNRHKSNWSAMHDMDTEESVQSIKYREMREQLEAMVNRFGFNDVATELRKFYKED